MMFILQFLFVILAVAFADVCWTMYFINTEARKPFLASTWSAMIMLASTVVTRIYVSEEKFIIAAVIGAFLGTFGAVYWKKWKESKPPVAAPETVDQNISPNALSIENAEMFLEIAVKNGLKYEHYFPLTVKSEKEAGVSMSYFDEGYCAVLEFYNTGEALCVYFSNEKHHLHTEQFVPDPETCEAFVRKIVGTNE